MRIHHVPAEAVEDVWPKIAAAMQPSLDKGGTHDAKDVIDLCARGLNHLYIQIDDANNITAAAVIDVIIYPKGKECKVWLAGSNGNPDRQALCDFLETGARANGCKWFSGLGRKGWNRYLKGEIFPYMRRELL